MLTIKVIDQEGYEFVKGDVESVAFNPPKDEKEASIFVWYKDKLPETFLDGKMYVMNENGKTISSYEIFRKPGMDIQSN